MLWLYNSQLDAARSYRAVADIRSWFFRYNLPDSSKSAIVDVLNERSRFFNRVVELFGGHKGERRLTNLVREDLEQLFILFALQRHKHESLAQMRWTLTYFVWFAVLEIFAIVAQPILK
jgi:hypothetical protein